MRFLQSLAAAAGVLSSVSFAASIPRDVSALAERGPPGPHGGNSKAAGRLFQIDGRVQYFAGTNAWWLGHLSTDADLETAMSEIASSGLKVVRTWAFGNVNVPTNETVYFQLLNSTAGPSDASINYAAANGIPRLDAVVSMAEKYNVQLVMTMLNNWNDLGGINTYCDVTGCNATTFYTDAAAQKLYQNYVKFIVNRYKSSSAVFSWELCNEPRCHGCPSSTIYNWASTTSAYIKSLDKSHMVTLGDEGWLCSGGDGSYAYSCAEGIDFAKNLGIKTLDYGTFHMYPDQWGYNYTWANEWLVQHSILGKAACKPVVAEEYGAQGPNMTAVEAQWLSTIVHDTSIAYDSFWQFGTTLPSGTSDSDNYTIYYDTAPYTTLVTDHVKAMDAKKPVANIN